jgi:D-serine deaminase-like pyridoxal phosphate-dependent protein
VTTAATCPGITELQAGGGVFGDLHYANNCGAVGYEPALSVLTTVVSRPTLHRAVLDAGRKTVLPDLHPPVLKDYPDAQVLFLSAEHATLELGEASQHLKIGDRVELLVGYHDFTVALHDEFYGFRGDRLEAIWPIWARGRLQ